VLEVAPKTQELYLSDLRMSGKAAALPFDIRGSGIGKFDSLQSYVTLTDLQGTLLKENLSLERPVKVECIDFGELFSLADFSLIVGEKGTLKGQWIHPSPSRSTLELTWRNLPFPIMAALTGIGSATGVMSGECHYQTTPRDAVGSFQMQAAVSRCGALGCPEGSLEITTEMSLAHLALTGNLSVTGTGVLDPLECSFSLPVIRQPKTPVVYLSTNEPITASLNGSAQISKLFYYWMPEEIGCEAILAAHTKVTGTLGDIKINGPVSLREGRMELLATGQTLESIEMDGQMHGRTLSINTISASDLAEGTLSGTGVMNFFEEGEFLWKLFLTCKDLEVVNLPYTNAVADAILTLDGTTHSLLISGNGTAKKAFVDVAARFPANIPELPVTFTGEKKEDGSFFVVNFDLHLEAPSGGEIRGRGLRTDWKGHAYLSGPATKLCLAGLVECTKGTFTLAGKELTISQGSIAVAGNLFRDSRLNVLANVSLPAITVQVGLKGSLKDPKFFIQSIPILPEKEVLSLLLFNKEYGDISPLESLQLANAAMTLQQSSGPFDLIDHVKTTLGIDLIDIGSSQIAPGQPPPWSTLGADNEDNEGMVTPSPNDVTLKVGKYISDGVAITVSKDVTAGVNRVGLEASLSQHVTADAEIGDDAGGIASLKWKKDY
jgi:translocation and assembly module TamB